MIVETYTDAFNSIAKTLIFTPDAQKGAELQAWKDGILTKFLTIVEKQLDKPNPTRFVVGNEMTIADFVLASFTFNILKNEQGGVINLCKDKITNEFPKFNSYTKRL